MILTGFFQSLFQRLAKLNFRNTRKYCKSGTDPQNISLDVFFPKIIVNLTTKFVNN